MTDDLVTWLRQQLDDDERVAREADPPPTAEDIELGDDQRNPWVDPYGEYHSRSGNPDFAHMLRHSPARVLDEVDAKRRILDFLSPAEAPTGEGRFVAECTLKLLALPYADRPGYRPEWRP